MPFKPPHRYRGDIDVRYAAQGNQRHLRAWSKTVLSTEGGTITGDLTIQGRHLIDAGTESSPGLAFSGDPGLGIYRRSGGRIGLSQGGATIAIFGGSFSRFPDGTAAVAGIGFINDIDTGIYRSTGNHLAIATGGTRAIEISSIQTLRISDGSEAQPGLGFLGDLNTGVRRRGSDDLTIVAGGVDQLSVEHRIARFWEDTQKLRWVGTIGPFGLEISPNDALEAALYYRTGPNAWSFENSGGTKILEIDIDGNFLRHSGALIWDAGNDGAGSGLDADLLDGSHASAFQPAGSYASDPHNNADHSEQYVENAGTTTSAANANFLENTNIIRRETSRAEFKENIRPWRMTDEEWDQITTHAWESKIPSDNGATGYGFVWDYLPEVARNGDSPNRTALLAEVVGRVKDLEKRVGNGKHSCHTA